MFLGAALVPACASAHDPTPTATSVVDPSATVTSLTVTSVPDPSVGVPPAMQSGDVSSVDAVLTDVVQRGRVINERHGSPFTYSFHGSEAEVVAWCSEFATLLQGLPARLSQASPDERIAPQVASLRSATETLLGDLADCARGSIDTPLNRRMNDSLDAYRQAVGELGSVVGERPVGE